MQWANAESIHHNICPVVQRVPRVGIYPHHQPSSFTTRTGSNRDKKKKNIYFGEFPEFPWRQPPHSQCSFVSKCRAGMPWLDLVSENSLFYILVLVHWRALTWWKVVKLRVTITPDEELSKLDEKKSKRGSQTWTFPGYLACKIGTMLL